MIFILWFFCNLNCFPLSIVLNALFLFKFANFKHWLCLSAKPWFYYNVLSYRPSMTTSRRLSRLHLRDPWRESWDTQRTRYKKYKSFWIIHNNWYALTNQLCVRHIWATRWCHECINLKMSLQFRPFFHLFRIFIKNIIRTVDLYFLKNNQSLMYTSSLLRLCPQTSTATLTPPSLMLVPALLLTTTLSSWFHGECIVL